MAVPMVWPLVHRPFDARLVGGLLMGLALGSGLISARLAGLLPEGPGADHVVNLLGLLSYPLLVVLVWAQRTPAGWPRGAWLLWIPAVGYAAALGLRGSAPGPFRPMLPLSLGYTRVSGIQWRRSATSPRRGHAPFVPVGGVLAFTVVLNAAQVARFVFRDQPAIRGLVPVVVTLGIVVAASVLTGRLLQRWPATPDVGHNQYERSGLRLDEAQALWSRICEVMETDRLYADPALSLARLVAVVGATPHQVSETLNRHGGTTFHDLVNRRRVADAKAQLSDLASDRFTIEGIGLAAGFRSRSAFYAAFRRYEGMTPTAFKEQARRRNHRSSPTP